MFFSKKHKETLLKIERIAVRIHRRVADIECRQNHIEEQLKKIMANQEEFNAQIAAANEKLDVIGSSLTDIANAIAAETSQIQDYINAHPSVDTSALAGVVDRLGSAASSIAGVSSSVSGIFEPSAPVPGPGPEPVPEPVEG